MSEIKKRLTADEVWEAAGFPSKDALLKACQRRQFPFIDASPRRKLFDPDDVNEFLDSKKIMPKGQAHA